MKRRVSPPRSTRCSGASTASSARRTCAAGPPLPLGAARTKPAPPARRFEKQEEFYAWLSEVKGVPMDQCGQRELKEHFYTYCEDYNTATLPDEKYYNLRTWFVKEQQRIAEEGEDAAKKAAATFERATFDDEGDRRRSLQAQAAAKNVDVARVMATNMSGESALVKDMREQQEMAQFMRHKMHTGDTDAARDMIKRLDPNHVTDEQLRAVWGSGAGAARKQRKPQKS